MPLSKYEVIDGATGKRMPSLAELQANNLCELTAWCEGQAEVDLVFGRLTVRACRPCADRLKTTGKAW